MRSTSYEVMFLILALGYPLRVVPCWSLDDTSRSSVSADARFSWLKGRREIEGSARRQMRSSMHPSCKTQLYAFDVLVQGAADPIEDLPHASPRKVLLNSGSGSVKQFSDEILYPDIETERAVKEVHLGGVGVLAKRLQGHHWWHLIGREEEQQVVHVLLGEVVHLVHCVAVADAGHPTFLSVSET